MANRLSSPDGQEGALDMRKCAVRKPSARISNKRLRGVGVVNTNTRVNDQDRGNNNMIVTMSIEQSDEIAVETSSGSGRFAASHTRQISRTSTLYDPLGIAIEVVCGSSVENRKEVVMDAMPNLTPQKRVLTSGRTGKYLKNPKVMLKKPDALIGPKQSSSSAPHTIELRTKFSFLQEEHFERLSRFNVQEPKDILNLTLLQLISTGIGIEQLELLIKTINENISCEIQQAAAIATKPISSGLKSVAESIDENHDDDEDKPLVIDETLGHSFDENIGNKDTKMIGKPATLRSVDDLEDSLGVVCNMKIPKSRAAIANIRSELSDIVADLNANEGKLMRRVQGKVPAIQQNATAASNSNNGSIATGITSNQEPIITTSKQLDYNVDVKAKVKAVKPVKRARRVTRAGRTRTTKANAARVRSLEPTETNFKPQISEALHYTVQQHAANTKTELVAVDCSLQGRLPSTQQLTNNTDKHKTPSTGMPVINPKHVETPQDPKQCFNIKPCLTAGVIVASNTLLPMKNEVNTKECPSKLSTYNHSNTSQTTTASIDNQMKSLPRTYGVFYINQNKNVIMTQDKLVASRTAVTDSGGSVGDNESDQLLKTFVCLLPIRAVNTNEKNRTNTCNSQLEYTDTCADPNLLTSSKAGPIKSPTEDCVFPLPSANESQLTKNTANIATKITNKKMKGVTRIANSKNCKNLKSLSAALAKEELKCKQPTVLLTKLDPYSFLSAGLKNENGVDADSTTTAGIEVNHENSNIQEDKQRTAATAGNNKPECKESEGKVANIGKQVKLRRLSLKDINGNQIRHQPQSKGSKYVPDTAASNNIVGSNGMRSFSMCPESPKSDSVSNDFQGFENPVEVTAQTEQKEINQRRIDQTGNLTTACNEDKSYESVSVATASVKVKGRKYLEEKSNLDKPSIDYDCDDVDMVVTIASPLSPISNGIASPTNSKANLSEYTPAVEVDGHLSYPPMLYILYEVDIPDVTVNKPEAMDALLRSNVTDPRLMKHTRKIETGAQPPLQSLVPSTPIQNDPRRYNSVYNNEPYTPQPQQTSQQQTPNMLLYGCLQRSPWYQSLMSTMKIQINQTISVLVRAINNFQKIRMEDPYAVFDIFKLYCAGELLEILENLGLFVDVNGVISERKSTASFGGHSYGNSTLVNTTYSFIQPMVTTPASAQPTRSFAMTPSTPQSPFVSCYIDSPPVPVNTPPPTVQRRHCGLKVPYISKAVNRSPSSPVARQLRYDDSEEECWDLDEEVSPPMTSSNSGYNNHHVNRPYPRQERNRDQRFGKKFGYTYRKRF